MKPLKKDLGLVDAFGVALNPMVESEGMFGRIVFCFMLLQPEHLIGHVFLFVFYFKLELA